MRRTTIVTASLAVVLLLLVAVDLLVGSATLSLSQVWSALVGSPDSELSAIIVRGFRVPKTITAILTGIALSVSGLLMQTTFKNPLAGPYVLGISSGASLGAAISLLAGGIVVASTPISLAAAAWLGAMAMLIIILAASMRLRSNGSLLILGVMLGAAASSGVSILQYVSDEHTLKNFIIWSMGSMANVTGESLAILAGGVAGGTLLAFLCVRPLNVLLLGQEQAAVLGVSMRQARTLIFLSTSLLAGFSTAFCGPIGFIGIAVPHVARFLYRTSRHGQLLVGCLLIGPISLVLADIVSQLPGLPMALPINAVTSLLGLPIVIYILIRGNR